MRSERCHNLGVGYVLLCKQILENTINEEVKKVDKQMSLLGKQYQ